MTAGGVELDPMKIVQRIRMLLLCITATQPSAVTVIEDNVFPGVAL